MNRSPEKPRGNGDPLESLQNDILRVAETTISLNKQARDSEQQLNNLLLNYQRERYQRQEEIWRQRGLIRCTLCYDVPPGKQPSNYDKQIPTSWGGWGLIPQDDAHYVYTSSDHWHRGHESDSHHTELMFHRLCSNCYAITLKTYASRVGKMEDLSIEEVKELNQRGQEDYSWIRKNFGGHDDVKIGWHNLPIPKEAYEIGQDINLEDLSQKFR